MYNYNPYMMQRTNAIKCVPVTSFDEVRSAMIEFDGSMTVYTDTAHGYIYTKQITNNGTAQINTYKLMPNEAPVTLETRVKRLEEFINEYAKHNADASEQSSTVNEADERESADEPGGKNGK